jgi:hypothetical protein
MLVESHLARAQPFDHLGAGTDVSEEPDPGIAPIDDFPAGRLLTGDDLQIAKVPSVAVIRISSCQPDPCTTCGDTVQHLADWRVGTIGSRKVDVGHVDHDRARV